MLKRRHLAGLGLSIFLGWVVNDAGHIAIFFIVEDDRVINFTFNLDGCDLLVRLFYRFDRRRRFLCVLKFPVGPANCRGLLDNDLVGGTADRTSDRIAGKVVETAATSLVLACSFHAAVCFRGHELHDDDHPPMWAGPLRTDPAAGFSRKGRTANSAGQDSERLFPSAQVRASEQP